MLSLHTQSVVIALMLINYNMFVGIAVKVHCQQPFLSISPKRARIWSNDTIDKLRDEYIVRGVQKHYAQMEEDAEKRRAKIAALAAASPYSSSVLMTRCYFLCVMFRPQVRAVWVIGYQSAIVELLTSNKLVTDD